MVREVAMRHARVKVKVRVVCIKGVQDTEAWLKKGTHGDGEGE